MNQPFVRDVMSSPVVSVTRQTRLPMIKHLLREKNIRRLPVLENGHLVGIISLGDVRNAFPSDATTLSIFELSYLLDRVTAEEIMRSDVLTIEADAPLVAAASVMLEHKVSGVPVVQHGEVVGMITESDIFRAVVAGQVALPLTVTRCTASQFRITGPIV